MSAVPMLRTCGRHQLADLGEGALEAALGLHAHFQGVQGVDGALRSRASHSTSDDVAGRFGVNLQDGIAVSPGCRERRFIVKENCFTGNWLAMGSHCMMRAAVAMNGNIGLTLGFGGGGE